jgi:hypothetical protein
MGSTFLTKAEAAERLGRTQRSIQSYVKLGFIRTERQGKKILLNSQDVEELAIEIGKDLPPMNRKTFWLLQRKFEKLEQDHQAIKEKVGMDDTPFRPSVEEGQRLLAEAEAAAKVALTYDIAEVWVSTIMRVDERVLGTMGGDKPYAPLMVILLNLLKRIEKDPVFPTSIGLQALRSRVEMARRRLKESILIWTEMGRAPFTPDPNSPKQMLLRRRAEMEAKKKKVQPRDKKLLGRS